MSKETTMCKMQFFGIFQTHHSMASIPPGFWLVFWAIWTFYFTDPMLETIASLQSQALSPQREAYNGDFWTRSTHVLDPLTPEVGGVQNS